MLSLLKMDVLWLGKSRSFYIILGVTAALIVSLVLMVIILICMGIMNQFDDGGDTEEGGILI